MNTELLMYFDILEDGDIGHETPKALSELRVRGIDTFEDGLGWKENSAFSEVEPKSQGLNMQSVDIVVGRQLCEVKLYNADGEHYASRWPREHRDVTKSVRCDRLAYNEANGPAERALARACDAFDKRTANPPKTEFIGRLRSLHGQLTRARLKASEVNALCKMVRDVCRGDSDSVCFTILAELNQAENKLECAKRWLKQFFAMRKAVSDEDAKLDRYTFESLEGTARAMGTNVELLLQHGAYMGCVTGHLYDEMPEEGEEEFGDFAIERVPGDYIWDTRRAQMVERVEEEEILRRHNVKSSSVPVILANQVKKPLSNLDGEYEVPVWDLTRIQHVTGTMKHKRFAGTFYDLLAELKTVPSGEFNLISDGPGSKARPGYTVKFQRARSVGGGTCRDCTVKHERYVKKLTTVRRKRNGEWETVPTHVAEKVTVEEHPYFDDYAHHLRVKHGKWLDITDMPSFALMERRTTGGRCDERTGWHIGCTCGYRSSKPVNLGFSPPREIADIRDGEVLSLASLDDMAETRFKNPEFVPGMGDSLYLNAQDVKLALTGSTGVDYRQLVEEGVSKHSCSCGKALTLHLHGRRGRDGRFWPDMVRGIDIAPVPVDVGTVENGIIVAHDNEKLIGQYVESIDDTHYIDPRVDWATRHPMVFAYIEKVKAATSLVKEESAKLRAEAQAALTHQEMRLFESVLNAEVRSRMLNEALESKFVAGFMQRMFHATFGDFHTIRNQVLRSLFGRDRTGAEKDFCFAFMNALEEELRAEALRLLNESGKSAPFESFLNALRKAGYIQYEELYRSLNTVPVLAHEHFLLQQAAKVRRQQLVAKAQPTETRNRWRELLKSGNATTNQAKAISIAASMARDNNLRQLALAVAA